MTFEEMHAVVATAHNHRLKVTGPLPGHRRDQERAAGRLRHARARHVHRRRGARHAARAQYAGGAGAALRAGQHRARAASSGCRNAVIDGHKKRSKGAPRAPPDPQGGRPAGHGRRLRLRLEPARRLRQGADASSSSTSASRRWRRSPAPPAPAPRSWAAAHEFGTVEAGKLADVLIVDGDVLADIALLEDRSRFLAVMQGGIVKAGRLANRSGD